MGIFGEDGNTFRVPMKKTIFNTSGFADLFDRWVEMVSDLFIASIKMILAHENGTCSKRTLEFTDKKSRNILR